MQNRILWADQAKALAISLMIIGHCDLTNPEWLKFIYIFHMPLFFFISGYFDKAKPFSKELLIKNLRMLMVPYLFFSICAFSICWISPYLHPELYYNDGIGKTFLKAFVGMFLMQDISRPYAFMPLGPLWFLVALFEVRIIFSLFVTVCRKVNLIVGSIALIGLFLVGYYLKVRFFSLDAADMAIPIYVCGYTMVQHNVIEKISKRWLSALLFVFGLVYLLFIGMQNGRISMDGADFGNSVVMFYLNAIIGSLTFIFMFKALNVNWKWLSIVGASTLSILGTHTYPCKIVTVLGVVFLDISPREEPIWFVFVLTITGVAFGVCCHKLITKYIPFVLGK